MDDDGYQTQQRRMFYQSDGRTGSRGEPGGSGGAQRVRILVPNQSSSASAYPQSEDASGPQVIRILPRAVYNLRNDTPAAAAHRRGSVDTGLSHVIRLGRNDAPQVLRVGGYPEGYDTSPRVIRIGQGYNPEMVPQVIRIGPSGRIVTGASGVQPSQYYTQRPQDFDAVSRHAVRDPSGTYSPPTMRVFAGGGTPYTYHQTSNQGSESPRIIAISSSQPFPSYSSTSSPSPSSSQPPNLRLVMRPRPEGGEAEASSEWQNPQQQDQYHTQKTLVQSPTVVYSSHPGYRTLATVPRTASVDQGSTGSWFAQGNGVTEGQAESRGHAPPHVFLRDTGRSDSREMFILGSNPVSIQMGGGSGPVGTRRGSLGVVQVIPMRVGQYQQPQQPQQQRYVQQQQQQQKQHPYVYTTSIQEPPRSSQEVPQVIRGRVITSGSDKMGEFDRIIADSIQQFLTQRQQQQQQQQQQHQQQYQGHVSRPPASSTASRPANIEISEVHYPCVGTDQPSHNATGVQDATGSGPPDDRNIFNKYKFKFDSIGNLSRSNSRDDGAGSEGDTGSWSKGRNAPIAIFRFNDFDDMVARMMELRQAPQTQQSEVGAVDLRPTGSASDDGSRLQQIPHQQMVTGYASVPRKEGLESGYEASGSYPPGQQPPWSRGQQGHRVKANMSREILRHKIEVFNNNANGLIMSLEQDSETFHGFVRVQMNLIRPVQMVVPAQPPTLYDVLKQDSASSQASPAAPPASPPASEATDDSQTTFFYLPKDTSKVIHINSDTTTKEVIRSLLSKFKIKDNPLKFALYHKEGLDEKTATMRRLNDEELPLPMCLSWTEEGVEGLAKNKFVLQENDTGEILWDAFSLPELESFLMILNREEEEYIREMKSTYRLLKIQLQKRLKELKRDRMQQDNNNFQEEHL